ERIAAQEVRLGIARLEREQPIEARKRLLVASERMENKATVRERAGGSRVALERPFDEAQRLGAMALLMANDPQSMQGIEIIGPRCQDLPIEALSLSELSLLMQSYRRLEPVASVHVRLASPW